MPELPEVETVRRGLVDSIEGKTINSVRIHRPNLRFPFPSNLKEQLEGQSITHIDRRAKYLLLHLNNNHVMIQHLGMSGRVLIHPSLPNHFDKHDHFVMSFNDQTTFIFNDARRFGFLLLTDMQQLPLHPSIASLGPEPLSDDFNGHILYETLKNKKTNIKTALMDQRVVAGLGNIYVCEALFATGIHPNTKANNIDKKKAELLAINIKQVLNDAIVSGGSTLRDYVRSTGDMGYFQHQFKVYGREDKDCLECNTPIQKIVQSGRSSFYCPSCQK